MSTKLVNLLKNDNYTKNMGSVGVLNQSKFKFND